VKEVDGQGVRGFRIWVGGGLGSPPRAAQLLEDFTSAEDLLITVEAAIRVFDRLGNRDDVFRARMKFVIDRIGIGEFRRLVLKERWAIRATKAGDPEMRVESEIVKRKLPGVVETVDDGGVYARWFETNVLSQKQEGYYAVTVTLPGGDVTARQFGALAEIAERYGDGTVRTTIRQNLVLRWIEGGDVERVYRDLERVDMVWPGADTVCDVVGCAGADTCNLGITRSHRLAMKLSESLSAAEGLMLDEDLEGVSIKVSGCPNACGQHHVATIGLFGETVTKVPAKRVPDAISKILVLYREKRQAGETFLSWVDRTLSEQGE
jgi:sulfite reductase beta subunit-like hemoprotein